MGDYHIHRVKGELKRIHVFTEVGEVVLDRIPVQLYLRRRQNYLTPILSNDKPPRIRKRRSHKSLIGIQKYVYTLTKTIYLENSTLTT